MLALNFIGGTVKALLRYKRKREADRLYIRAYKRYPETEEELAWAVAASHWALEECPWEDDARNDGTEHRN